ncbi:MAG TPA: glycosyltransferase family 39 protein [Blastocatellia bacterium]|nr:glycosyltransferase family 39 protein [Blastocatellia bacterium]
MPKRRYLLLLLLLWSFIYLLSAVNSPPLLDDADSVHAEAAREMAETSDWITLHANRIRYLEKAPLMYWSVAASYKIFGVSEFSSRLPIALATFGLMLATWLIGSHAFGARAGFYSAAIIASCVGIFLFTRVLWPDVLLTMLISLAFYCFIRAREGRPATPRYVYGIYVFGALGILTKGLIGAVFPAAIIGGYLVINGELRRLREFKLVTGPLLFLLVAAPWHILAGLSNKTFLWFYFVNEQFKRYIGTRYPADYDTVPLGLFLALHLVWLFPWSFFLPLAVKEVPRRIRQLDSEGSVALFCWVWVAMIILFFSFSTTQEYYTMPAYPAMALLIARALTRAEGYAGERASTKLLPSMQAALTVLSVAVFGGSVVAYYLTRHAVVEGDISATLTRNPEAYALSLGHILDLTPQSVAALRFPIIGTGVVFLAGSVAALYFRLKRRHGAANVSLALMMAAFFFFANSALATFGPYLSSKALAEAIMREYKQGEVIVINGEYEGGSSINFYTREMVYILNGRTANLEYGSHFEDAPKIFLGDDDIARMWSASNRVYLFTDGAAVETLTAKLDGPVFRFAESGGKVILTNKLPTGTP